MLAQFRVNGIRIIVAEESQARIDFLLDQLAVHTRKGGQHLDQCWQKVRGFRDRSGLAQEASQHAPAARLNARS